MKRLALVLAAAVLGTGCIWVDDDDCDPTVTVEWSLLDANGNPQPCGYEGVRTIDVWVDGGFSRFDCLAGAGTVPVFGGLNDVTVEGLDDFGAIILRDRFTVDAPGCGHHGTFVAQPAEGWVSVQYTLPGPAPSGACFSPGPSFMWVLAWDELAGEVAVDSAAAPELFACGAPLEFRLATGSYTLLDTHEVIRSGITYAAVSRDCVDRPLTVGPALVTDVPSALVEAVSFCP